MNGHYSKKHHTLFYPLQRGYWLMLMAMAGIWAGCNKDAKPIALETSPAGQLSRYDLTSSSYDILPVTGFNVSYNKAGQITDQFERSGQTLLSFNLTYNGKSLSSAAGSDLSIQTISYNASGKPLRVDYHTITDTGKLVFSYSADGKLIGMLDSIKKPENLPVRYQYFYTYDAAGSNVVQITKNTLDLQGRPTLSQYSFYTFDTKPNPFTVFPYLRSSNLLPGDVPALVNKNNILSTHLVGTIPNTSSGGSVPTLDTITTYTASRTYQYNSKGYPSKATEKFNDLQFNYSGNRTFTYEY